MDARIVVKNLYFERKMHKSTENNARMRRRRVFIYQ